MKRRVRIICLCLGVILLAGLLFGCGGGGKKVTIASKQFTENVLLSEMYAQLIESHTDIEVERKQYLGGTSVSFPAMEKGEVDIYPEYSGTIYNEILKLEDAQNLTADQIAQIAKEGLDKDHDITMFSPIGINNTFALGMLRSKADELNIKSMSDLKGPAADLRFGANHLYYTRENDGYDAMVDIYGMAFKESQKMDSSLLYEAIDQGQLDVIVVYATDSLLKKYDMVILEDDQHMFPAYYGTPICRNDTLEKYPELKDLLDMLKDKFTDESMQALDYEIDVENKTPQEVAKNFLTENGLLK
ncbi:MAG: glycine betaine ABC transporter substrate-binding protein [Christensenellales bacterium]|jgi:osmoprotectant transport system substrate-binding protein